MQLAAIPIAWIIPSLALRQALDDALYGVWDPWVGTTALYAGAVAVWVTAVVLGRAET
jgi:hypothetical protein